jgi:hypothetical protein
MEEKTTIFEAVFKNDIETVELEIAVQIELELTPGKFFGLNPDFERVLRNATEIVNGSFRCELNYQGIGMRIRLYNERRPKNRKQIWIGTTDLHTYPKEHILGEIEIRTEQNGYTEVKITGGWPLFYSFWATVSGNLNYLKKHRLGRPPDTGHIINKEGLINETISAIKRLDKPGVEKINAENIAAVLGIEPATYRRYCRNYAKTSAQKFIDSLMNFS